MLPYLFVCFNFSTMVRNRESYKPCVNLNNISYYAPIFCDVTYISNSQKVYLIEGKNAYANVKQFCMRLYLTIRDFTLK